MADVYMIRWNQIKGMKSVPMKKSFKTEKEMDKFLDKLGDDENVEDVEVSSPNEAYADSIPKGDRYPRAKRKLSASDIEQLDKLYYKLNRMPRGPEFDKTQSQIDKLLGESMSRAGKLLQSFGE